MIMSGSQENLVIKQPIRRLEIQISNFNVAIPHHVDLLKRHKNNIRRYEGQGDWEKVHKEHVNASRIIKQLKELLYQMDTLRAQVLDADIQEFDRLTAKARASIMSTINDYLELQLNLPMSKPASPRNDEQFESHPLDTQYIQLQQEQEDLERQKACLHAWNSLQSDVQQLHQLFVDFNQIVHEQKELVNNAEDNIEETQVNVDEGTKYLEKAAKYKAVAYPLAGALLGTCVAGPIGLIAGLKIGGLTALGGGLLGFTGGSLLKKKQIQMSESTSKVDTNSETAETIKPSASLPDIVNESRQSDS